MLTAAFLETAVPGCNSSQATAPAAVGVTEPSLTLIASYAMNVSEPSDLTINETGTVLWTVSDRPGRSVYQLTTDGTVVKTLDFVGEDLEGIVYDPSDQTLWVAEENRREVVHLDLDGNVLSRKLLGLTGENNSGLEGISLDDSGRMFLLNEKNPGLFIQLDSAHSIAAMDTLSFAGDYSGMTYNPRSAAFWIVSDQSRALYLWSLRAGVVKEYPLPFPNAEGVAVDEAAGRIYLVSDSENKLYVFQLPPSS